jgi:acyl transferase domain-containing protein
MAGRFPGASDIDELWEMICAGREGIRFFSDEELDSSIPEVVRREPGYVPAKGIIDDVDKFDAAFFGIPPLEAEVMDPQQRIMLEMAWSALEAAGHAPSAFDGLIGVYAGMNWNRYRTHCVNRRPDVLKRFGEFNVALANEFDFLATRISYKLNLRGPSVTVGTACSTALVCIAQASQALLDFECDLALAGGVSVSVPVNAGYLHQEGGMLSADGHCRTFDAKASGTTFNDGAGFVVLRRLEDAIEHGDPIYAIVRGFAVNNDGADKVSFTAPSVSGQAEVIASALDHAGVDPASIGLIEAHGTGTPLGDPIEIAALRRVFEGVDTGTQKCAIGSIKSSVGHLVHAAGVAGFIKAVLAVYHARIPPSLFFESPNPRLELDSTPFYVPTRAEDWLSDSGPRRAAISAFGVGGTNAHVIIEQAPELPALEARNSVELICLSAKSPEALERRAADLADFLETAGGALSLSQVAATLQSGREAMPERSAWPVSSVAGAISALRKPAVQIRGRVDGSGRVGYMFAGQGAQRPNMMRWLYDHDECFREKFAYGAEWLNSNVQIDLTSVVFDDSVGASERLEQTRFAQPALFLTEYCLVQTLFERGLVPQILLGHSIGEFVAAAVAGVFTLEDALRIVALRGEAMQSMPTGAMSVVYCGEQEAQSCCPPGVVVAAVNAPEMCVLSGRNQAIEELEARLVEQGKAFKRLRTSHAFHSPMMENAAGRMREALQSMQLGLPEIAIISTLDGSDLGARARDPDYWAQQAVAPVRFAAALDTWDATGGGTLLEVAPGTVLTTLARQHSAADRWRVEAVLPGCGTDAAAEAEVTAAVGICWVRGAEVDWARAQSASPVRRVALPTYPFERVRYWLDPPDESSTVGASRKIDVSPGSNEESGVDLPQNGAPTADASAVGARISAEYSLGTIAAAMDGVNALRTRVIGVLEDVSGYELGDVDVDASFSELGFDSMVLTQVSTSMKQEFGVDVSFRALMEDCGTISTLTDRLADEAPDLAVSVEEPSPATSGEISMANLQPPVASLPAGDDVRALIDKQLAVMQLQLQALGGMPAAAASSSAPARPAPTGEPTASRKPEAMESKGRRQTPGTRIDKSKESTALTQAQKSYVKGLVEAYGSKTPESKAFAQEHRRVMADPRTVSGFNLRWKEIVYPIVTNRSKGSKIWDLDGNEYLDLTNGFGPIFFGHSPDFVTEAVLAQIDEGIETGPQTPLAGEVAQLLCEMTGNERMAYANTGSEAVLAALRLARTVTRRDKVVIFEGGYHGIFDEVVVRPGKGGAGLPAAPGIPRAMTSNMIVLPYGTDESLARIEEISDELAAVMVEPVQSRKPGLQPIDFLRKIREITSKSGTAFIFDEVVTGFRVHPGGAQALLDIRADLAVYGKVVAGGYPIGVLAGKAQFMDALDGGYWEFGDESIPEVGVTFFAGTFVRHPVALAAARAVLRKMREEGPDLQLGLAKRTADMAAELKGFLKEVNANVSLEEFSSYFYISVSGDQVYGALLFYLLRMYGIHTWEFRPCFLTTSHSDEDIEQFKDAFKRAVSELIRHGLLQGDAVAVERLNAANSSQPPVEGARLGKDEDGIPSWYVADPDRPGKYIKVGELRAS